MSSAPVNNEENNGVSTTSSCSPVGTVPTIPLRNGVQLPVISLGTAHVILEDNMDKDRLPRFMGFLPERAYRQVQLALENGIRSFESGRIYRTQRPIGRVLGEWLRLGLLENGRSDVFLTTKVYHGDAKSVATQNSHMHDMDELTCSEVAARVTEEVEEAIVDLGVGYIDLLLLHWPATAGVGQRNGNSEGSGNDDPENADGRSTSNRARRFAAWKVLEGFYEKGWIRAIGVSNFSEHHLEQLHEDGAKIVPMVNQIEASVSVQYRGITKYCRENGIVCQAFSPFKRGDMSAQKDTSSPILEPIMKRHNKNVYQISLRYLIQKGYAVIYLSTNEERMKSNHDVFDFCLADDEMIQIDALPSEDGNWGLPTPYDLE